MIIPTITYITNDSQVTLGWQFKKVSVYQEEKVQDHLSSKGKNGILLLLTWQLVRL